MVTPAELVTAAMKANPQSITDCGYLDGYGTKWLAVFAVTKTTLADIGKLACGLLFTAGIVVRDRWELSLLPTVSYLYPMITYEFQS